jgi:hypothetical protein
MTVEQVSFSLLDDRGPWTARRTQAAEAQPRPAEPIPSDYTGGEVPIPLVAAPPLIPRIFPGL